MLVYGDSPRRETVADKLQRVRRYLDEAGDGSWIERHGLLVAALIEAGELAQGIADRAFEARGRQDAPSPDADAAMCLVLELARSVGESWRAGEAANPAPGLAALDRVRSVAAEGELTTKLPEGFAHYALYPETYLEAALPLAGTSLSVIGIRSIGTTLAAAVAAGAGAPCPATVRPVGHPFARELALPPGETLGIAPGSELAIVDEGPGLSGSSILAVAEAASREGVEPGRIHVFPSHRNGPGPQAGGKAQAFWSEARTHFRSFDDLVLLSGEPRHRLESWVSDLVGEPIRPIRELTGGGWRELRFGDTADWPPAHPWQERRKFLLETASGPWLLKFAGLGRIGIEKAARAKALAEAGFVPRPLGFRHGFVVERWHEGARPLDPAGSDRPRLLTVLAEYLGFRSRHFAARPGSGASARQLLEMLRFNAGEEFGNDGLEAVEAWRPHLARLGASMRPVETDNRLHAWEWLALPDGTILKTDALDHHAGHDLIGCQDIAWDIAGAALEFVLSPAEQRDLIGSVERVSRIAVDPAHVRFATLCYPAFQLGYYREAIASTADEGEAARLHAAAERYSGRLRSSLSGGLELGRPPPD